MKFLVKKTKNFDDSSKSVFVFIFKFDDITKNSTIAILKPFEEFSDDDWKGFVKDMNEAMNPETK